MPFAPTPAEMTAITDLQNRLQFRLNVATAFVRARGRCEYCMQDLLKTRLGYAVEEVDHLLPQRTYPSLENHPDNWVLSCSSCNGVKGAFDPKLPDEDGQNMLVNERQELINRARRYIRQEFIRFDNDWRIALEILGDLWWDI